LSGSFASVNGAFARALAENRLGCTAPKQAGPAPDYLLPGKFDIVLVQGHGGLAGTKSGNEEFRLG